MVSNVINRFSARRANTVAVMALVSDPRCIRSDGVIRSPFTDPAFAADVHSGGPSLRTMSHSQAGQLLRQPLAVDESGEIHGGIRVTLLLQPRPFAPAL